MYSCVIAYDLVPPNSRVRRFSNECGHLGFEWSREGVDDWQIFVFCMQVYERSRTREYTLVRAK
jgi:hypothetical protein